MKKLTVYAVNINDISAAKTAALSLITPERQKKALAYRFEEDRLRCIAAGLLLRKYCGITSDGQITYNEHGKPLCEHIEFNISHSGNWVLLCTANCPVGIDIEKIKPHNKKTAEHCFCADELEWMQNKSNRFFMLWTRKESITKAIGKGLKHILGFSVMPFDNTPHIIDGQVIFSVTKEFSGFAVSASSFEPFCDFDIITDKDII